MAECSLPLLPTGRSATKYVRTEPGAPDIPAVYAVVVSMVIMDVLAIRIGGRSNVRDRPCTRHPPQDADAPNDGRWGSWRWY